MIHKLVAAVAGFLVGAVVLLLAAIATGALAHLALNAFLVGWGLV